MNNPFLDKESNSIVFPYQGVRDVTFVYPQDLPDDIRGVLIPDRYKEFYQYSSGIVLSVGPGYYQHKDGKFVPTTMKVGDWVLFDLSLTVMNWKMKIKSPIDGKEYLCNYMGQKDIQGIIEI